jgi:hypothetical protein
VSKITLLSRHPHFPHPILVKELHRKAYNDNETLVKISIDIAGGLRETHFPPGITIGDIEANIRTGFNIVGGYLVDETGLVQVGSVDVVDTRKSYKFVNGVKRKGMQFFGCGMCSPVLQFITDPTDPLICFGAFDPTEHSSLSLTTDSASLTMTYNSLESFLENVFFKKRADSSFAPEVSSLSRTQSVAPSEKFVSQGKSRTIDFIRSRNSQEIAFQGRSDALVSLLLHAASISTKSDTDRSPITVMHASPGVGKTRVFQQLVMMSPEERVSLLSSTPLAESKRQAVENLLPTMISFNDQLSWSNDWILWSTHGVPQTFEFYCAIRLVFVWLLDGPSYALFVRELAEELAGPHRSRILKWLDLENVLRLIWKRSGNKRPYLLIDEPLLFEQEVSVFRKASYVAIDEMAVGVSRVVQLQDFLEKEKRIPVAFTALKTGLFAKSRSASRRKLQFIPLELVPFDQTKAILSAALPPTIIARIRDANMNMNSDSYPRSNDDILNIFALIAGGHMRSTEFIIVAARSVVEDANVVGDDPRSSSSCTLQQIVKEAKREYSSSYIFGAAVGLKEAMLLALYRRPVLFKKPFPVSVHGTTRMTTMEDLIGSGLLMATSENNADEEVVSKFQVPLLALLSWCEFKRKGAHLYANLATFEKGVVDAMTSIEDALFSRSMEESFESFCHQHSMLMRHVYAEVTRRGRNLPLTSFVDWRRASIADMYPGTSSNKSAMTNDVAKARFDVTQPLTMKRFSMPSAANPIPSCGLPNFHNIRQLTNRQFEDLVRSIYVPSHYDNAAGLNHFVVLRDVTNLSKANNKRRVVVLAVGSESPWECAKQDTDTTTTSNNSVTARGDASSKTIKNVRDLLVLPRDTEGCVSLAFVLHAWREEGPINRKLGKVGR